MVAVGHRLKLGVCSHCQSTTPRHFEDDASYVNYILLLCTMSELRTLHVSSICHLIALHPATTHHRGRANVPT